MIIFARTGWKLAAVAAAGSLVLAACGSSKSGGNSGAISGAFGTIPAQHGTPSGTGTLSVPEFAGVPPTAIFPVTNSANYSIGSITLFQYFMWRPLYFSPDGYKQQFDYPLSIGTKPVLSSDGKTVTFSINKNYKWSNGTPVTGNDVLFWLDILKAAVTESPANWGGFTPGQIPDNITSAKVMNTYTVQLTFNKVYNPGWLINDEVGTIIPLPSTAWDIDKAGGSPVNWKTPAGAKAIYDYLAAQSGKEATYASNPLWKTVDGPFKLTYFNPSTGSFDMAPNPSYGGPYKAHFSQLDMIAYTSDTAEFDALKAGTLSIGNVPFEDLAQVSSLKSSGYHVFGYPGEGWNYIAFNFKDTTGHWNDIVSQLYVRQALAHLMNDQGIIKGIFKGAAIPAYSSVPCLPPSTYSPSCSAPAPYPYSISAAKSLLTSHGWKVVPGGTTTCQRPGAGMADCGAGIPKGTPLSFNLPYSTSPVWIGELAAAYAATAKKVGITVTPQAKTFTYLVQNYNNVVPANKKNVNAWAADQFGGFTETTYPTTDEVFNITGSENMGSFTDPTANSAIMNSLNSPNPNALKNEIKIIGQTLPGLFEPESDNIWAWKSNVTGPPAGFETFTQFTYVPEELYLTK
jgi:peptide/nickel transport system substrate-binding protein